ncbi:MAG: cardiolipin synthase [Fusobacteriaceae bacterium]
MKEIYLYILEHFKDYIISFNIFFLLLIIFFEKKRPVQALFWISLLIFAPYLGFISFLFLGLSLKKSRIISKFYKKKFGTSFHKIFESKGENIKDYEKLIQFLETSSAGNLSSYSDFSLIDNGKDFFATLLTDINCAKKNIYMEYFSFHNDELGEALYSALMKKSEENVKIKIILDGVNAIAYWKLKELRKKGIEVEIFFPSLLPFIKIINLRANYRDHKKITVIDNDIAYIGGFNIGKEYIGKGKLGNWRDTALRLRGPIVNEFQKEFSFSWNFIKQVIDGENSLVDFEKYVSSIDEKKFDAQLVSSGPNYEVLTARNNILKMILSAEKSIYIETPYFVPDDAVLDALKIAALSGIKIKIIIPDKSDHFFIYWVNQAFAWDLLKYGVHFYHYKNGFIHSKLMIIDDKIATLGTVNFDYRSFYQNFELNINLYNGPIIIELRNLFIKDLKNSKPLTLQDFGKRTFIIKIKESVFRLLSPIL